MWICAGKRVGKKTVNNKKPWVSAVKETVFERRQKGFTLLEVMVALAVFAVLALALIKSTTGTVTQARLLEEKTLALWIAQNQLDEMRLPIPGQSRFPAMGRQQEEVTLGGRKWQINIDVASTDEQSMRRIDISVFGEDALHSRSDEQDLAIVQLTGFIGEH